MTPESPSAEPLILNGVEFAPISPASLSLLGAALARSGCTLWAAYPPFLLAYGASPARDVLVGEVEDGLAVLVRRKIRKRMHLDLLVPPLCTDSARAIDALTPSLAEFNGDLETRILWADLPVVSSPSLARWTFPPYEREYVYSRQRVLEMMGHDFRMLRKRLHRCEREAAPVVRPFEAGDVDACIGLLNRWQDAREEVCGPVFDYGYTRASVEAAADIPGMAGIVAEVDGAVAAFAFGGPMSEGTANFFLIKSDPDVIGLSETVRVELIRRLEGFDLVNDAGDLGRAGLAQHKSMFRPVAFVPTWKGSFRI